MKLGIISLLLSATLLGQVSSAQLPRDDVIRVEEFYRLAAQLDDQLWDH